MCRADAVLILIFLINVFHKTCFGTIQLVRVEKRQTMSNLLCDGHEKWTMENAQSTVECALLCNHDDRRTGMFYNAVKHTCHCRGSGQFATGCVVDESTEFYSFVNCDNGYTMYEKGNFCYKIHSDCTNSWMESADNCENEGGGLINLWDDTTSEYFQDLAPVSHTDCISNGFWIGFRKVNDTWKWLDDTPVDLTKYWRSNEPSGNELCGTLYRDFGFLYNDMSCLSGTWNFAYICSRQ